MSDPYESTHRIVEEVAGKIQFAKSDELEEIRQMISPKQFIGSTGRNEVQEQIYVEIKDGGNVSGYLILNPGGTFEGRIMSYGAHDKIAEFLSTGKLPEGITLERKR